MILSRYFILSAIFLCSVVACGQTHSNDVSDPKKTIMVRKDSPQFLIKLASNPTTGFSWHLKSYDATLITPERQMYQPGQANNMPGAGGFETFVFKINPASFVVKQVTQLTFVYARPWNMETAKEVTFKVVTQ